MLFFSPNLKLESISWKSDVLNRNTFLPVVEKVSTIEQLNILEQGVYTTQ